jgi:hypothetical protein
VEDEKYRIIEVHNGKIRADCGTRVRPRALESLPPHGCVERQRARQDALVTWVVMDEVGGYVCAVPDPSRTGGVCGMPVESEACPTHALEVPGA